MVFCQVIGDIRARRISGIFSLPDVHPPFAPGCGNSVGYNNDKDLISNGPAIIFRPRYAPVSGVAQAAPAPAALAARALGRGRSLRWQVIAALAAINLGAALVAGAILIGNARRATEAEIRSSLTLAERLVDETVRRLGDGAGEVPLDRLPLATGGLRHVRIAIEDAGGRTVETGTMPGPAARPAAPGWFAALIAVPSTAREFPVIENGRVLGRVRVVGDAADEIAEVWEDMSDLAGLAAAVNLAILAALYLVLGRLLRPLEQLSAGLSELEAGRFDHRLPISNVPELARIATRFNALGAALTQARHDNARLNERLVGVQDEERRQIASELHDELGPCLFGLRANLESIDRVAAHAEPSLAARLSERSATMAEILDRIQGLNRRLLRRIRPMALGHVPLAALIADLVAEFERHSPGRHVRLRTGGLADRYGDSIDITIYRCVQEAVTNALRHGAARHIRIDLHDDGRAGCLALVVEDDGSGMPPHPPTGLGLRGIGERIGALGGSWRILPAAPRGTRIEMRIPHHRYDGARPEAVGEVLGEGLAT